MLLKKRGKIYVNFSDKKIIYRCQFKNKKKEMLAKAVGIKKNYFPTIIDTTAGFGIDALILACLGCKILLIEKNEIIYNILLNGIKKGSSNPKINKALKQNIKVLCKSSIHLLNLKIKKPDVIYIDPMYPKKKKKSLPKKRIQFLRRIVKKDSDSKKILFIARKIAKKRIVVKRPKKAPSLSKKKQINFSIFGKSHRFDIYKPLKTNSS